MRRAPPRTSVISSANYGGPPNENPPVAFLLFLSGVCTTPLTAQTFTDLKELKQVNIVVEELDVDANRAGITRGALESQALGALQRDMPKVEVKDFAVSYVYLRVITSFKDNWCAVRVVIQLWRRVMVLRDDGEPVAATLANVRERGTTLTGPGRTMGPKVLADASEKITEMAADYNKANP